MEQLHRDLDSELRAVAPLVKRIANGNRPGYCVQEMFVRYGAQANAV